MKKQLLVFVSILNLVSVGKASDEDAFFAARMGGSSHFSTQTTSNSNDMDAINYVKAFINDVISNKNPRFDELVRKNHQILREEIKKRDFDSLNPLCVDYLGIPQYVVDFLERVIEKKEWKSLASSLDPLTLLNMIRFLNRMKELKSDPVEHRQ